ncbi:regulatory signaling modulator protein AmpE [Gilvimarinus polysaccharolyticus]|uniref:regulatory signaling modulator protein AmpE n=1 Tax=Gilvimarinus polysaccharolyticus TaxID=863921 RepID=UPI0006738974|nr:regulatory signaling modulator protein AmpE [Gilvimarinus polysaccharolyticus]
MTFISLVIVLLLVQWWGSGKPLHRDQWFFNGWRLLHRTSKHSGSSPWLCLVAVAVPVIAVLAVVIIATVYFSDNWLILLNIPVLLYSLGRGDFSGSVHNYTDAAHSGDSVKAITVLDVMNLDPDLRCGRNNTDWVALNREALRVFTYRGFERMFAVIFWFLLAGAPGALAYRLSVLLWVHLLEVNDARAAVMTRALTLIEWPAARLLGLSWALVGHFEFCMVRWRNLWMSLRTLTPVFLVSVLLGAMGEEGDWSKRGDTCRPQTTARIEPSYSLYLVESMPRMFSRALLLWVFAVALVTLLI